MNARQRRLINWALVASFVLLVLFVIAGVARGTNAFDYEYGVHPERLRLTVSANYVSDSGIYEWNFDDRHYGGTEVSVSTTPNASHTYSEPGFYTVCLSILQDGVKNHYEQRIEIGYITWFVWKVLPLDSGGWILVVEAVDGATRYEWRWGDDTVPAMGITAEHFYETPGEYYVSLRAVVDGSETLHTKQIYIGDERASPLPAQFAILTGFFAFVFFVAGVVVRSPHLLILAVGLVALTLFLLFLPGLFGSFL